MIETPQGKHIMLEMEWLMKTSTSSVTIYHHYDSMDVLEDARDTPMDTCLVRLIHLEQGIE